MNRKIALFIAIALVLCCGLLLLWQKDTSTPTDQKDTAPAIDPFTATLQNPSPESLQTISSFVLEQFEQKTPQNLARIMTSAGVRFSPSLAVDATNDRIIGISGLSQLFTDPNTYVWGTHSASGDPINLTGSQYVTNYITNEPFATFTPTLNQISNQGNIIPNLSTVYPNAQWIEYLEPGTSGNSNMDWNSLILVYEYQGNQWFLVGIVSGAWTI